jgi:hypothetical protein
MPTNRPFIANLLVAFRAHSAATSTSNSSNNHPTSKSSTTKATTTSSSATAAAVAATSQSPTTTGPGTQQQPAFTPSRGRRSSSSSTDGFVEPPSGEKWWIGGRNSDGQERFYRLQPVRRHRSYDRLSLDRMSLWRVLILFWMVQNPVYTVWAGRKNLQPLDLEKSFRSLYDSIATWPFFPELDHNSSLYSHHQICFYYYQLSIS